MPLLPSPRLASSLIALLALPALAAAQEASQTLELPAPAVAEQAELAPVKGEKLDPQISYGPQVVEGMEVVLERERLNPSPTKNMKARNGAQGSWSVPSIRSSFYPHSGDHYLVNRWGDTNMWIEFDGAVDFDGLWISGHADPAMWAAGVRVHGYRGEVKVASSEWLESLNTEGQRIEAGFDGVTRIEIEARPVYRGAGWYGLDDLAFTRTLADKSREEVVLDFDELSYNLRITGSHYAGLTWPSGTGSFEFKVEEVHTPKAPEAGALDEPALQDMNQNSSFGGGGTAPVLVSSFTGPRLGDTGAGYLPPDTHGAVGPSHFVAVVNQNMSVYDRTSGNRLISVGLRNFWNTNGSAGDPRAVYDHHAGRFIVIATDFDKRLLLAVSMTDDPTGSWFKTTVLLSQGVDANRWPDYPTLGVDATGIYSASYMVGSNVMSIFAIDKAPLLTANPSLGTVSAWRNLPWEGAIQPAVTHGTPGRMYCISRRNNSTLRLRYVTGPMNNPTLNSPGNITVPSHASPPDAPAMGSVGPLDALDWRPMNSVFRNGSLWMTHGVRASGRAACRWYEIDPMSLTTIQTGTIDDLDMSYMMPSIAVNANGDALMGFSGSSPTTFASCYVAGRVSTDPLGQMSLPVLLKAGGGTYNHASANAVNRWGDYSNTCVDPLDDTTFWTIQEYARVNNNWGTRVGEIEFPFSCSTPTSFCQTSVNSTGASAAIGSFGLPSLAANSLELFTGGLPLNKPGLYFLAPNQGFSVLGNGFLCLSGSITRLPVISTGNFGLASYTLDLSSPPFSSGTTQVFAGDTRQMQFWYRDPAAGGAGFNLSDGLSITFCP